MDYYAQGVAVSTWICENCEAYIPHTQYWQLIAAQCHILDKEKYISVKLLPLNRLHLCAACHMNWDNSWARASTMKVFPLAVQRLRVFVAQVTEPLPPVFSTLS